MAEVGFDPPRPQPPPASSVRLGEPVGRVLLWLCRCRKGITSSFSGSHEGEVKEEEEGCEAGLAWASWEDPIPGNSCYDSEWGKDGEGTARKQGKN